MTVKYAGQFSYDHVCAGLLSCYYVTQQYKLQVKPFIVYIYILKAKLLLEKRISCEYLKCTQDFIFYVLLPTLITS